jgi:ERF superfamily
MEAEKFAKPNGAEVHPPMPLQTLEIQQEVNWSRDRGELAGALAKAQLKFKPILKESENPAFVRGGKVSKYADLHSLISATMPALAAEGLVIIQSPTTRAKELVMTSTLLHSSGQWCSHELTLPAADDRGFTAHSIGKAITYARRYSWQCLIGATAEEDDDGNEASGVGSNHAAQNVAKKGLEEKLNSPDPKIRQMAQDGLAAIRAKEQGKSGDLAGALQESIAGAQAQRKNNGVTQAHIPLEESLEAAKDDGLFDEVKGTVQQVRIMSTSAAKGNRPYRKIAVAVMKDGGEIADMEISAFDNFPMSDGTCFGALDHPDTPGCGARLIVERNGKYFNLKDIKQLGKREWDARVGVVRRD